MNTLDAVFDLCRKINMPDEMTAKVMDRLAQYDFAPLSASIGQLADIRTSQDSFNAQPGFYHRN